MIADDLKRRLAENLAGMRQSGEWTGALLRDLADAPTVKDERWLNRNIVSAELSEAELRVLTAASHGLEYSMIADLFTVERVTVQSQLRAARLKLRAKNTTHACCIAMRRGLIK